MKQKRFNLSVLWIAFWAILPATLALFVIFNLRAGMIPDTADTSFPAGKIYFSLRDRSPEPEVGQLLVVYEYDEKEVVMVVTGDTGSGDFTAKTSDGYTRTIETADIWGVVSVLGGK